MRSWNSKGKRGEVEEQLFLGSDFSLRDRERKIIEIEKEELEKRENEVNDDSFGLDFWISNLAVPSDICNVYPDHPCDKVRRRSSDLDELRRGHRAVEDKLEAKVKELKMELEDR